MKTSDLEQVHELADRFEQAWDSGKTVDLAGFLPPREDSLYLPALHELIKSDLEIRWRRGQAVGLESYREKFPELLVLPAELIYEEYRIRQLYGDRPALNTYQARFPDKYEELQALVRQQPVKAGATPAPAPTMTAAESQISTVASNNASQAQTFVGAYKRIKRIGSGGFGEVWRAEAPGGVEVAIKIIFRPVDHEEAQRELEALELIKKLRHPFLLQTQAFMPLEDRLYVVMDLAEGNLRDRLKECKAAEMPGIPLRELVNYFRESAEALDYLHSEHVHHRDIKPDNILILKRHARVADFGLARLLEKRMTTVTGSGTPPYMAPEVWRGKASQHSDQYSLAITYAELRLNRRMFPSRDLMQLMLDHMERMPDLEPLAKPEQEVLLKALAKEPDQRYGSCQEFADALHDALGSEVGRTSHRIRDLDSAVPAAQRSGEPSPATVSTVGMIGESPTPSMAGQRTLGSKTELPSAPAPAWRKAEAPRKRRPWLVATTILLLLVLPIGLLGYQFVPWARLIQPPTDTKASSQAGPEIDAFVPAGCTPTDGAIVEDFRKKKFHKRVIKEKGGQSVPFLAIPQETSNDQRTFYIMETKASNALLRAFMEDTGSEERKHLETLRSKYPWAVKDEWKQGALADGMDLGISNGQLPAMRMTALEAHCCAQWLGGKLPLAGQWDAAAGRSKTDAPGPFRQPGDKADKSQIAVGLGKEGPMPVGTASHDISIFGCRDMAGNGREWTRNVRFDSSKIVGISEPNQADLIELRGQPYTAQEPLVFATLSERPESGMYTDANWDTGFRVVLEQ